MDKLKDTITRLASAANGNILDSGDRTLFKSGAVRDIGTDKGRCDLLPLEEIVVLLIKYDPKDYHFDDIKLCEKSVLYSIDAFLNNHCTDFLYEALLYFIAYYYNGDVVDAILDLSIHFKNGAEKYAPNNWKKGIPVESYMSSGIRHFLKVIRKDDDENHKAAFMWNMVCCIWTCNHIEIPTNDCAESD